MARRPIHVALTIATFFVLLAIRIGPARALVVFLVAAAVLAIACGVWLAVMVLWWPDGNGENWFTKRRR